MSEPARGWAIKGPDGKVVLVTTSKTEDEAWSSLGAVAPKIKLFYEQQGYRAVQVEIREVEDGR